jgi:hypothetical protein
MPGKNQSTVPTFGALNVGEYEQARRGVAGSPGWGPRRPFITISRQAGAGGRPLAARLVDRLNEIDPGDLPWKVWGDELVERVAAEHHLSASRVTALEDEKPSWLEEALAGFAVSGNNPDEATVFRGMTTAIRALAELGRVVIVGRGAVYHTGDMPGGVHVRLVAPVGFRIAHSARARGVTPDAAGAWVRDTDRARESFYHRHWPARPLAAEAFAMTLNTAALSVEQQAKAVLVALPGDGRNATETADRGRVVAKTA